MGWIAPNEFVSAPADMGAMFLLFRVGLDVKSSELLKVSGTAAVLAAKKLLTLTASKVIQAAAVIDDVLGLIVLALVTSVARGRWNLWELVLTAGLAAFSKGSVLLLMMAILGAVVVSKVVGCGLGALRLRRGEAVRVGVGMLTRGEVCVAVARLGLTLGIIRQCMYSVVILVAVAAATLAPPLLNVAFRNLPVPEDPKEQVYGVW